MRKTGFTFRLLLRAIYSASLNDSKSGVYVYAYSETEAKRICRACADILSVYVGDFKVTLHDRTITLPNNKRIYFRSLAEKRNVEKRKGIDWTLYDEMTDHD